MLDVTATMYYYCAGENSEGTRATKITTEEANGIGTTATPRREKEVRYW